MRNRRIAQDAQEPDWLPEAASRARILDLDGREHELRELWAQRPVLLVFLRHFG